MDLPEKGSRLCRERDGMSPKPRAPKRSPAQGPATTQILMINIESVPLYVPRQRRLNPAPHTHLDPAHVRRVCLLDPRARNSLTSTDRLNIRRITQGYRTFEFDVALAAGSRCHNDRKENRKVIPGGTGMTGVLVTAGRGGTCPVVL